MKESYPFPVYSGLMDPKHYKRIGSAIWLFLWCISSTTEEVEKDGVMWGIVLGNKPVKISELQEVFGVKSDKTIRNWIDTLERHNYISVNRSPYGLVFSVNKSKKFNGRSVENYRSGSVKNYQSDEADRQKITDQPVENYRSAEGDRQEITDLAVKSYRSKKDITEINATATTAVDREKAEFEKVLGAFCEIHERLEIHVKPGDIRLMTALIAEGIPADFIIDVMQTIHRERAAMGVKISTFAYYKSAILDAWAAEKAKTEGVPVPEGVPLPPVALGSPPKKMSKAEYFRQKAREAREREIGRGVDAL